MTRMRMAVAAIAVVALTGSAFAADGVSLAPGKPAGVQKATRGSPLLTLGVAVVVAGAIGIAIASSNNATPPTAVVSTATAP